ncbi:hypothetical protein GCM10023200_01620 [Actinomycetospora chlora]|uniref:Uncharacterized protein n=1 Tax=Actinomycetospora chlora TaxID=663608 RepID=A0ABP9A2W3_9PSEU
MMQLLDGTCLSHSGIAVRVDGREGPATHLASALTRRLPGSMELGGVRWDPFEKFRPHRDLYTVAMPDDLRARALEHLARFRPRRGEAASFSVVKLVTVAAALRSVELQVADQARAERLFGAARAVAATWAASDDAPSYYCAELAATAYGRPFTRAEMTPPAATVSGLGDLARTRWSGRVTRAIARVVDGLDEPRRRSLARLLGVLAREDRGFLHHAAGAIASSAAVAFRRATGVPSAPEPLAPPRVLPALVDPHAVIPYALVTPRMLWAAFGRESLRRVGQPT